ncbi:putative mechanosensitive ion channel MscS, LSM domain-containing protein [Medicago truncatula]|uniref:Mechanosensitive ion channel-like protein n=1 Tax=Medicago truncatula TaxID=3880 RepID=G7JWE5_MEDTR|nr:mechanosensitive ion channel protein 2, chloroplastic isoform X1 [Medicago truncatula]XP_039690203.1 mechanosensitive ion channel protein 2, chloroplastic isoform X1 [Medicago truncatula]AES96006.2 mechanosensitive ion channel-like protein [Medicago truncatula]RHN54934.1 putative mechanosensitive ion channel MscS, LSM domain-containing protein [Medicago truncatula]
MALPGSLQLSHGLGLCRNLNSNKDRRVKGRCKLQLDNLPLQLMKQDYRGLQHLHHINRSTHRLSRKSRSFKCHCFLVPGERIALSSVKVATTVLTRCCNVLQNSPVIVKLIPAVGIIIFAVWGVGPLTFQTRKLFFQKSDNSWKKSTTHYIVTSYLRPLLLWTGAVLICRAFEPVILPTEASQAVKERLLNFVKSLATVVAFAYCLSSVIQQAQKIVTENVDASETRNMGFQFAGKAVYSAVWIAAFSLFMELLGFSTQKWVTAGGFGTVLLTLAGREIFTNFLSSAMIHATRPFVVNEWIQTKIEGYEVSGTVEHVGWWSPTIIRGEDREAVHIPNHKFTVNVVRNLTQKTHWRIKTHLAISHLDVNKINNIVADMRKVLAKNPQVEQQRLHRRVFLDNINPENQALMILISCFVKTSHFEEYLCVKETILLDLLRVISHHRARLATPVRTLQKIYADADLDNIPYADTTFNGAGPVVSNRPLLVIDSPYKNNADDKTKSRSTRATVDQDDKTTVRTKLDSKTEDKVEPIGAPDTKVRGTQDESEVDAKVMASNSDVGENKPLKSNLNKANMEVPEMSSTSNSKVTGLEVDNSTMKDIHVKQSKVQTVKNTKPNVDSDNLVSSSTNNADKANGNMATNQQGERKPAPPRPVLEENIVLGVALDGSKRTLPINDEIDTVTTQETKEMAASQGGNGSPKASDGNVK